MRKYLSNDKEHFTQFDRDVHSDGSPCFDCHLWNVPNIWVLSVAALDIFWDWSQIFPLYVRVLATSQSVGLGSDRVYRGDSEELVRTNQDWKGCLI